MTAHTNFIPAGFHTVTPYLSVQGIPQLLEFLEKAFAAQEIRRTTRLDSSIGNIEIRIGNSVIMLGESWGEWLPTPTSFYLYVEDTDRTYAQALQAGGTSLMEPADQFYGDRNAGVRDLAGNCWWIATHLEDLSTTEIQQRSDDRESAKSS